VRWALSVLALIASMVVIAPLGHGTVPVCQDAAAVWSVVNSSATSDGTDWRFRRRCRRRLCRRVRCGSWFAGSRRSVTRRSRIVSPVKLRRLRPERLAGRVRACRHRLADLRLVVRRVRRRLARGVGLATWLAASVRDQLVPYTLKRPRLATADATASTRRWGSCRFRIRTA
jgi:hypothetical protein